ncbi:type I-E CRISPR-associated protein Cas6/Cse3/CasE [Streptomyces sp. ISL-1]|nr:type I-E CRISPR-associated protein Cas6/Cse3/CasE [Streptomyces sp. ISL-1]
MVNAVKPRWAGFNLLAPTYAFSARIASLLAPQILVMAGGHHAKAAPDLVLRDSRFRNLAALVIGEGETRVAALLEDVRRRAELPKVMWREPDSKRLLPEGTTHMKHEHHGDRYELSVRDRRDLSFDKSRDQNASGRRPVSLVTVTFEGRLEVGDPGALRGTLTQGLGRAKAYGCGLMTLAPLPGGR